ncbi:putative NRPS-like enzyme [Poronia punctata]|nr:putative NRPS-like enzyme [Poronia punctata]
MTATTEHERAAQWKDDLIPHVVDRLARERPDARYAEWVTGDSVVVVTYSQLANMINGLAWWIVRQLGGPGSFGSGAEVLTYVGPNDARYGALVLAAIKAGYVLFVTSPRNSPDGHRALFDRLRCRTLLTPDPIPPAARLVVDAVSPSRHLAVPSIEDLLTRRYEHYDLDRSFQEIRQSPFVIMHTSGTTGLPKPIIWTHETCAQVLNSKSIQQTPFGDTPTVEASLQNGKRVIVTLPPFHGALLAQLVVGAIPYGNVVIAPVAAAIPTARAIVDALKKSPADIAIVVPSVVSELAEDPELLDYCASHLETIIYIGGDLPQSVGDKVASKLYLRCLWGATETGIVPQLLYRQLSRFDPLGRSLWRYVQFHPCVGAVFEKVTGGVYELVVRRDKTLRDTQPCFTVPGLDHLNEYRTKDLFEPHPNIPNIWCWRARADDIIVFLNGEKTNPISMEQHIMTSNPEVSGALVIGAQRFQAALLIESSSKAVLTTAEEAELIERIWPSVEDANRSAPAHARIEKPFIMILPADKPLIRAGKGTFMREPSIGQYKDEIERLYANSDVSLGDHQNGVPVIALHSIDFDGASRLVRHHICDVTDWQDLGDGDNFFERGMDSLQGLRLVRALRTAFHRHDFALSSVYQNPTVSQLTRAILAQTEEALDELQAMRALYDTYRELIHQMKIPRHCPERDGKASKPVNVMFTGSTGSTGVHILRALLKHGEIGHIYCVNRREDGGRALQFKGLADINFDVTGLDKRVTFIKADLQQPYLGLGQNLYESLRRQVGLIIHAAWPVNFNLTLSAFRPQFAAVVNLLAFGAVAASRFVFISSVAAVGGSATATPEEILQDFEVSPPFGYGRAKFIAELLTDTAAQHFKGLVPTTVLRIGQVAGAVRHPGLWNPKEWFPSMVLSSLYLGQVPDSLGHFDQVDFVPVDILADVILEIATTIDTHRQERAAVFNVRSPNSTPWRELLPAVIEAAKSPVQAVAPKAWLEALRESIDADEVDMSKRNPAVKLLGFFNQLWATNPDDDGNLRVAVSHRMDVGRALAASSSLQKLAPVGLDWMKKWVDEWVDMQHQSQARPDSV